MKIFLSVIVCTYNRSEVLFECLKSLAEQVDPGCKYEVIVVNNNCTDRTHEITDTFIRKYSSFKEINEIIQGLSNARNRGLNESSGEYVAFIDDDAKACPDWINQIVSFVRRHPEISAFGGPYVAFTMVKTTDWFPSEYGRFDYGYAERPLVHNKEWINGTNMIFTKDLLTKYGGFNTQLGMRGYNVSYGEDTSFIQSLMDSGIVVFYVPTIKVLHLLSEYKMNLNWLLMAHYRSGLNYKATFNKQLTINDYIAILLKSLFRMLRCVLPPYKEPFKREIYNVFAPLFLGYGTLCEKIHGLKDQITRTK